MNHFCAGFGINPLTPNFKVGASVRWQSRGVKRNPKKRPERKSIEFNLTLRLGGEGGGTGENRIAFADY